eukprot:TRINITY_DN35407_c0_g1_i1.p1 TRINITY_DN35407_c0_g1~~TRINITY_DN35407_c0_g1_i1.p1  ORF type:complete len:258 (+),score=28.28 TRINITY_DN35407_c0_g1_i1:96-869(+)
MSNDPRYKDRYGRGLYPEKSRVRQDEELSDVDTIDGDEEDEEVPWVQWFCSLKGNEFFVEVEDDYIQDDFNLTGLSSLIPFYDYALDMILDLETPGGDDLTPDQQSLVETAAETLYGLIHARYILTQRGMRMAEDKYHQQVWGRCPRVMCNGQAVLPAGQSDVMREASIKVYCPLCGDIYHPRSSKHKSLDGAFWGTTFPHLFIMCHPQLFQGLPKPLTKYVPRIYGFKVRKPDKQGEEGRPLPEARAAKLTEGFPA